MRCVAVLALLLGCNQNPIDKVEEVVVGPNTGSETHWLSNCQDGDACPDGSTCICGVCTALCEDAATCEAGGDAPATCVEGTSAEAARLCGALPEAVPGVCAGTCVADADCPGRDQVCDEGVCAPRRPVEERLDALETRSHPIPERDAIDFLFVIDDSGSMCEEQALLTERFEAFAPLLTRVDYRVAVVSTDTRNLRAGEFLARPAQPMPSLNCLDEQGEPATPNTVDCAELVEAGQLPTILGVDPPESEAMLARQFRCLATLGTSGDGFEQGLDAMRFALSCDGPNADRFGGCCRDGAYDRTCLGARPDFLRPDASLVVVFVTDENDCSAADGTEISRAENSNCEWFRHELEPVRAYRDFLVGLKGDPSRLSIWAFVGDQLLTESGHPVRYDSGRPEDAVCDPLSDEYDPDLPLDMCCPEGICLSPLQPSCDSDELGIAFDGYRYAELAATLPSGCHPGEGGCGLCGLGLDLAGTFEARSPVLLHAWCLNPSPACLVSDAGALRPCAGEERTVPGNYALSVEVFDAEDAMTRVAPDRLALDLDEPGCGGAALLRLLDPPPPGGRVRLRYLAE